MQLARNHKTRLRAINSRKRQWDATTSVDPATGNVLTPDGPLKKSQKRAEQRARQAARALEGASCSSASSITTVHHVSLLFLRLRRRRLNLLFISMLLPTIITTMNISTVMKILLCPYNYDYYHDDSHHFNANYLNRHSCHYSIYISATTTITTAATTIRLLLAPCYNS
jgi:hypothetical protein